MLLLVAELIREVLPSLVRSHLLLSICPYLHRPAHIKHTCIVFARRRIFATQVNRILFVAFDIQALVHCDSHPGWLQTVSLNRISALISLRCLLAIAVFLVHSDPPRVFAQQAISDGKPLVIIIRSTIRHDIGSSFDSLIWINCVHALVLRVASLRNLDVEVIWHRELSLVTVQGRSIATSLLFISLDVCEDFRTHLEL